MIAFDSKAISKGQRISMLEADRGAFPFKTITFGTKAIKGMDV